MKSIQFKERCLISLSLQFDPCKVESALEIIGD